MAGEYRLGDSASRAVRKVKIDGLELPARPDYTRPQLPSDITAISAEELMELFSEITSWLDYIEVQLAAAQIDEKYEEQQLEEVRAHEQVEASRTDSRTDVTTKKALAFESEDFRAQRDRLHNAFGYRRIVETIYNSLERARFIVSREITRRTGDRSN